MKGSYCTAWQVNYRTHNGILAAAASVVDLIQAPPALRVGSDRLFQVLDLYWRSPKSGDLWYTSSQLKTRDDPATRAGGTVPTSQPRLLVSRAAFNVGSNHRFQLP